MLTCTLYQFCGSGCGCVKHSRTGVAKQFSCLILVETKSTILTLQLTNIIPLTRWTRSVWNTKTMLHWHKPTNHVSGFQCGSGHCLFRSTHSPCSGTKTHCFYACWVGLPFDTIDTKVPPASTWGQMWNCIIKMPQKRARKGWKLRKFVLSPKSQISHLVWPTICHLDPHLNLKIAVKHSIFIFLQVTYKMCPQATKCCSMTVYSCYSIGILDTIWSIPPVRQSSTTSSFHRRPVDFHPNSSKEALQDSSQHQTKHVKCCINGICLTGLSTTTMTMISQMVGLLIYCSLLMFQSRNFYLVFGANGCSKGLKAMFHCSSSHV